NAQAEADVAQPAGTCGTFARSSPGPAPVVEHRAPDAEQAERIPIRIDALLDVEQQAAVSGLVVPRISAQAGVAPEHQLAGEVGILEGVAREGDKRQAPAVRVAIESDRAARQLPVERRVTALPGDRCRTEQDPVRWKTEAVARAGGVEPEVFSRAEARQRAAQLNAGLGSHREVLGTLDEVPVFDLLVVVLHELVAEKAGCERLIQRKLQRSRGRGQVRFESVSILQ